ncbi:hypothetical protein [Haloferula sp. BvORR071]|uniref:hypothetical protein n=1 Tax=Haloferula sp. BvORR071 TaxID=1396141 RepID=UPI000557D413|nr:hypothetical protein [Haloferula sp. BvORR071]
MNQSCISRAAGLLGLLFVLLLVGCGRNATEYDLDEKSFDADSSKLIEDATGFDVPAGARGLRFHYVPPIDPIYFAKYEIPAADQKAVEAEIAKLMPEKDFPDGMANNRCTWWPKSFAGALISKKSGSDRHNTEVHLIREEGRLVLYLKYRVL